MDKKNREKLYWLRDIVAKEPWDEEDLADWANNYLASFEDEQILKEIGEKQEEATRKISVLKAIVRPYLHKPGLPALPKKPDGQLYGIGFIYDGDRDDRVLVAIDKLKTNHGIVALAEHEGDLQIHSRQPIWLDSIEVGGDEWNVNVLIPYRGHWTEITEDFKRKCLLQVLGKK